MDIFFFFCHIFDKVEYFCNVYWVVWENAGCISYECFHPLFCISLWSWNLWGQASSGLVWHLGFSSHKDIGGSSDKWWLKGSCQKYMVCHWFCSWRPLLDQGVYLRLRVVWRHFLSDGDAIWFTAGPCKKNSLKIPENWLKACYTVKYFQQVGCIKCVSV